MNQSFRNYLFAGLCLCFVFHFQTNGKPAPFKVLAFYTANHEDAHTSFVLEANEWFSKTSKINGFEYFATNNWTKLNTDTLANYQVVIFLEVRTEDAAQRKAFQEFIENGGAFMGFHFAAFALTPSAYPQNWDWYHNQFLGSGEYVSNTWRPTSAILKVEDRDHAVMKNIPEKFTASPNEWYRWQNDLRKNPNIRILASIDSTSFPLGTGPKPHEIWHSGYYPVVWTNTKYRMIYFNMGHNDIDFGSNTNKQISFTFQNKTQNQVILNALLWLGRQGN
jgi:type 1 glutamine amidotransferase